MPKKIGYTMKKKNKDGNVTYKMKTKTKLTDKEKVKAIKGSKKAAKKTSKMGLLKELKKKK